jgi:uncharacterized protein YndB with AHSA1/START domain
MEKVNFSTCINASREKIWQVLWNDSSYPNWTSVFTEGSHAITDNWKEGTRVLFLDPKKNGMVSMVASNRPNEFMSFRHLGEVKDGVEDTSSEKVKEWSGAMENYFLKEKDGNTELRIEMDVTEDFKDYFTGTWPKALLKIKELAETGPATITVKNLVHAPVEKVWALWSEPQHITQWNHASADWHTPTAKNDLMAGGHFTYRMEARDGSMGFDFGGIYDEVKPFERIAYTMSDGRKVKIDFTKQGNKTNVAESFEAENTNSLELQRSGWQSILDNFKKYAEET